MTGEQGEEGDAIDEHEVYLTDKEKIEESLKKIKLGKAPMKSSTTPEMIKYVGTSREN